MKKELPFVLPITNCYPAISEASGILFSDEYISNWMFNNFIQIFQVESNGAIDYYDFSIDNNPFLSYNEISYEFVYSNWKTLNDFIISCINNDYYVRIFNNMKKNPIYKSGNELQHDMMIFGYDDENQIYKIADHFRNGRFSIENCSYQQLLFAVDTYNPSMFQKNPAFLNSVQIIQKEKDLMRLRYSMYSTKEMNYILTLNVHRIILSLIDYIEGKPTTNWYTRGRVMDDTLSSTHKWGIDCYDLIMEQIRYDSIEHLFFLVQSCYVLDNHKKVMIERIERIDKNFNFAKKRKHIENYKILQNLTNKLLIFVIKLRCVKNREPLVLRITELLSKIKQFEYDYMAELISDLIILKERIM